MVERASFPSKSCSYGFFSTSGIAPKVEQKDEAIQAGPPELPRLRTTVSLFE
jgi:hypothetical protein